jgi:hypothetical protein
LLSFILATIVAVALFLGPALFIRAMARKKRPFYWLFVPANTVALIVSEDNETGEARDGGGSLIDALHDVPGKWLDKHHPDPMKWRVRDLNAGEVDPDHAGIIFSQLGVQKMGLFRTVRTNLDKRIRFSRERESDDSLHNMAKDKLAKFVYYSGELTIHIEDSDTADGLGVILDFDIIFERIFPVRSVLRIADAPAFLTSNVEEIANAITAKYESRVYFQGHDVAARKKELADAVEKNRQLLGETVHELGLLIKKVNLRSVGMKPEHRELLERKVQAETAAEAALITAKNDRDQMIARAEGESTAKKLNNEADADRVQRVIIPTAREPRAVALRFAEALENNEHLTSIAIGGDLSKIMPDNVIVPMSK